jgi:hypothetical protein
MFLENKGGIEAQVPHFWRDPQIVLRSKVHLKKVM